MYKKTIFIIIAALSLLSCKKDPTNVAPTDNLDNITYPKTLGDLQSFLIPGYSNFRNVNLFGYMYLPVVLSSDHTFCSQNSTGNPLTIQGGDFLTNNISATNTPNAALFSQLYVGVAAMNVFFERAQYYQNTYGTSDAASVTAFRGEAYFLRAYYFYMLENFYGEKFIDMKQPEDPNVLGISLPVQFASDVALTNLPRSSAYKVWSQIIRDLDSAKSDLQNVTYDPTNEGRVTKWTAEAMLGKVYVFTQQWDSAGKYLADVINNSGKTLMPYSQYSDAFNGDQVNKFNNESLFEINVDRQADQAGILFSSNFKQSLTTDAGELYAPTIIGALGVDSAGNGDGNGGTSANMGNNYCKYFVHDKNLKRFGFTIPPYSYVANPNASGPNSASNPAYIMDPVSWAYSLNARTNKTVDPRLFVCAQEPWLDSCEQPYTVAHSLLTQANEYPDTIPVGKAFIIDSKRSSYWGWSFKKYTTTTNAILAYGGNDGSNLYLLRLADVYLLYAEARFHIGGDADAQGLLYLNMVHQRAYSGAAPSNYTSLTNQRTLADASDINLANNPIRYERYVELFGEGGWWFDVCRWGIGSSEAAYYVYGTTEYDPIAGSGPALSLVNSTNWSGSGTQIKAEHFPIPNVEIATNTSIQRNNYPY